MGRLLSHVVGASSNDQRPLGQDLHVEATDCPTSVENFPAAHDAQVSKFPAAPRSPLEEVRVNSKPLRVMLQR